MSDATVIDLQLIDGDARYWPAAFDAAAADALFRQLRQEIDWREESVLIFGQRRRVPRRVAWHGDAEARYSYSGVVHDPEPWTQTLSAIRQRVETLAGAAFNGVLLNLYRDGADAMGWHADDEPELGRNPVVASLSLGAVRRFRLRHRRNRDEPRSLDLAHGSLLLMRGATQHNWVHAVPKTARPVGERINLTFRRVLAAEAQSNCASTSSSPASATAQATVRSQAIPAR